MAAMAAMAEMARMESALLEYLRGNLGELAFSLGGLLRQAAAHAPEQPALLEPGRASLTYRALFDLADKTIRALNGMGFGRHSRVALAFPTTAEGAAVYLSVMPGMTILPVSQTLPADEFERYLKHARADALLVPRNSTPQAHEAASRLGIPVIEVVFSKNGPVGAFDVEGGNVTADNEPQYAEPEDIAFVLPTSGTTSLPKLVPRTQKELALIGYFGYLLFQLRDAQYPVFNVLPLHHASGFSPLLRSVAGRVGFVSALASDVNQVYRYLAIYRPASLLVVPAVLQALASETPAHGEELGQLRLRRLTVVSAALSKELLREAQRIFGASVQILYGMTEMNTIAGTRANPAIVDERPGSVGQPLPFCQVAITDEDGTPVPPGQTGEITVLSPLTFGGYERDPDANAWAFRDGPEGRWFRTGDAGHLDAGGYLYLTGRVKEMINRGGSKVTPGDVDAVLAQHPAVVEAATFGFPHAALGEDVAAAVVLSEMSVTERDLRSFAARHLAMYKVPSRFVFVSEIPKTSLGKVRRVLLTEQFGTELMR